MARRLQQRGVTLIELMIALAIGLVIVLAASTAFLAGNRLFNTDSDVQAVQDTARFARHVVQGLIRQAGYSDYAPDHQPDGTSLIASSAMLSGGSDSIYDLNIVGASNVKLGKEDNSIGVSGSDAALGNDSLLVRFYGRTNASGSEPDGTMVDCFGVAQGGLDADAPSADNRAWSFFFVPPATDGEPELHCKYKTAKGDFKSAQLARGVEKFKVVYGFDTDGDSVPEAWLDAKEIEEKGKQSGSTNTEWRKVVAVRVGMVVRSGRPNADLKQVGGKADYRLFPLGPQFGAFDPPDDGRFRSVTTFTVMLRNAQREPA